MAKTYIGVGDKSQKVQKIYIGVDGVAKKVKKAYLGVNGVAKRIYSALEWDPILENNSWEVISEVSRAGIASIVWNIGDTKPFYINGVEYTAEIIGFDHDTPTVPDSYKRELTGITFQMRDLYATTYRMTDYNNSSGWVNSEMRKSTLPTLLGQINSDLQAVIVPVDKYTSSGNMSSAISTTSDSLFLLSGEEIVGKTSEWFASGEGLQYEYYSSGKSKIKTRNGKVESWYSRSPRLGSTTTYCGINVNGTLYDYSSTAKYGVSFAFCV